MVKAVHFLLTLLGLGLGSLSIYLLIQYPHVDTMVLALVVLGAAYDSLVIAMGSFLHKGSRLRKLNRSRFLLHSVLVPGLVIVAGVLVDSSRVFAWKVGPWSWIVALALVGLELGVNFRRLQLHPMTQFGLLRYVPEQALIPYSALFTTGIVGLMGFLLWQSMNWPWLLLGALGVVIGQAFPSRIVGPILSTSAELMFLFSVITTEWHLV